MDLSGSIGISLKIPKYFTGCIVDVPNSSRLLMFNMIFCLDFSRTADKDVSACPLVSPAVGMAVGHPLESRLSRDSKSSFSGMHLCICHCLPSCGRAEHTLSSVFKVVVTSKN